jgi:hypothetical protein
MVKKGPDKILQYFALIAFQLLDQQTNPVRASVYIGLTGIKGLT